MEDIFDMEFVIGVSISFFPSYVVLMARPSGIRHIVVLSGAICAYCYTQKRHCQTAVLRSLNDIQTTHTFLWYCEPLASEFILVFRRQTIY